nr:MAG TPA: hypothetical protein [Caudoviricetes sp.]
MITFFVVLNFITMYLLFVLDLRFKLFIFRS